MERADGRTGTAIPASAPAIPERTLPLAGRLTLNPERGQNPEKSINPAIAEIGAPSSAHPLELLDDLANRALAESSLSLHQAPALAADGEGKARLLGLETETPVPEPAPLLPAPGGPALFDTETLADLVNEALVEQARRHGVDLS